MINERDLQESFIRSSGPGGQNVNKLATCVVLRHIPTGIMIKCQEFRTQHENRQRARVLLAVEVERRRAAQAAAKKAAREKKRRQARGRSKAGKERVLEQKKRSSLKKRARGRVLLEL